MLLWVMLIHTAGAAECHLQLENRFDAPFQVYAATATVVGDTVVLAGGETPSGVSGDIWRLKDLTTWEKVGVQAEPRFYHGAAHVVDASGTDQVVLLDGYDLAGEERVSRVDGQAIILAAEPRVETWAASPVDRYLAGTAAFEGRVYVAGGHRAGREFYARVDMIDPASKAWSEGPPLSVARDTRLVVAEGRLYALGGFNGMDEDSRVVERLTEDGTGWEPRKSMPDPVSAFSVAVLHGGIFTFGDYTEMERVFRYDLAGDTWQQLKVDFVPRRHSAAATVGDRIVVVGGTTALTGSWMATTEIFAWTCGD